jgi:hypothetical protein
MANSAINEVAYPLYKSPCCEADETISTVHWELVFLKSMITSPRKKGAKDYVSSNVL